MHRGATKRSRAACAGLRLQTGGARERAVTLDPTTAFHEGPVTFPTWNAIVHEVPSTFPTWNAIVHEVRVAFPSRNAVSHELALIRMFLAAPILDVREGGGPRRPTAGVPQGGTSSPLLAKIYLHLLDRSFRKRTEKGDLEGRLIRYCDDFVLLTRHPPTRELSWPQQRMGRLGLVLHADKTRVVDLWRESFDFLGYRVRRRRRRLALDISPKPLARSPERLRRPTRLLFRPGGALVSEVNAYVRGAPEYFRLSPWWSRRRLDSCVDKRFAQWFRRKPGQTFPMWSRASGNRIHREDGVLACA